MTTGAARPTSIWNVGFITLIFVNLVQQMGQQMATTVTPLYADTLGASASAVGFVVGAFAVTAIAVRPFAGPSFDSFSKKWLLLGGYSITTVGVIGYGFVTSVHALFAMRLIHGIGAGFGGPLSLALASEFLPANKVGSGVSVFMLAQAAAQAIGPAVGIELTGIIGYSWTFWASAILYIVAIALVFSIRERETGPRKPYHLSLDRMFAKRAVPAALILFVLHMPFMCTASFMALYGYLRGVSQIGLYFTVYAVAMLVTRPLFGKLADRYGTIRVVIPTIFFYAVSFIVASQATTLPVLLISAVLAACGYGVTTPLMQALMIECVPADSVGAGSNTTFFGFDVGCIVGPMLGGLVIDLLVVRTGDAAIAYSCMWLTMLIPIAVGLVLLLAFRKTIARYIEEKKRAMVDAGE